MLRLTVGREADRLAQTEGEQLLDHGQDNIAGDVGYLAGGLSELSVLVLACQFA